MKPTNFSKSLTKFLTLYLPGEKGMSQNTILSYKDAFVLFLVYAHEEKQLDANIIEFHQITQELILGFLDWLETNRHCCPATRNVRLAALHSFFRYVQYQSPEHGHEWQKILAIPVKRTQKGTVSYLTLEAIRNLLKEPDQRTRRGRRDLALLSLLYESGCRVAELIQLTPSMVRLEQPCTVKLVGKGNKARIVPLLEAQIQFLSYYMQENNLLEPHANQYPLFHNSRREKLTRTGVNYILKKYVHKAKQKHPGLFPDTVSCHCLRHSKAMHLLQAGVNLVYIRDILGHSSVQVTEVYARVDSKQKREAIEKAYSEVVPKETPSWEVNDNLLQWLMSFPKL
jgi:integrase/recombinase XerD